MPDSAGSERICVLCGLDCSDRPRVKDEQGRYACRTCAEESRSERKRAARPSPSVVATPTASAAKPSPLDAIEDDILRLEQSTEPDGGTKPTSAKPGTCPICLRPMLPDVPFCTQCNFDPRKGLQPDTRIGRRPIGRKCMACANCGYDLTGLPSLRCPECGELAKPSSRRDWDRESSRQVAMQAYLTPLLMLVIGGFIASAMLAAIDGPLAVGAYLVYMFVYNIPVGVLVFFACSLLWIGVDAPLHLTALRLAGIYAVVDVVRILTGFIPIGGLLLWIVPLLLYVYLLAEQLELEVHDAFIVAILTGVLKVVGLLVLTYYLGIELV